MKRTLCFLLTLVMLFGLLAGCGGETNKNENKEDTSRVNAYFKEDPADDGVLQVLLIGNSFCHYFTDELYEMLAAEGKPVEVTSVYYSGCRLEQYWTWLSDKSPNFQFTTRSTRGTEEVKDLTLEDGLQKANWDIITLQQHYAPSITVSKEEVDKSIEPYMGNLMNFYTEKFPDAQIMWHQTWAYEVGYTKVANEPDNPSNVLTVERQKQCHDLIRQSSLEICEKYKLPRIPCGDAWAAAREHTLFGDTLCRSIGKNDHYHDGNVGGGQLLNAYCFFEMITGKSPVGNTYRPNYAPQISEEKFAALQQIAHDAVTAAKAG